MKVFVTGGSGFAGSHLVKRLITDGHEVTALARKTSNIKEIREAGAKIAFGDITDSQVISDSIKDMDWVFNIAAAYRQESIPDKQFWDVNFESVKTIIEACLKHDVKRIVHCSTIGVVTTVKDPPGSEASEICPGDTYQRSKCAAELEVIQAAKEKGLPASVIRPCAIYGPGDTRMLKFFRMIARKRFIFFGNGKAYLHTVFVENLVDGFILAATKEEAIGEVFIIGDEKYVSLNELAALVASEFGVPVPKIHLPYKPFELLAASVEFIYKRLKIKKEPPIYKRRMAFFKKSRAFSIDKASKLLGYRPKIDLETGIRLTAEWYKKNGYI